MAHSSATPEFLAEHYLYEIAMLRAAHASFFTASHLAIRNALIESFAVHARSLLDFFTGRGGRDNALARHFTATGDLDAHGSSSVPKSVRERLNKQITHLTYARIGAVKIGLADRLLLLAAIEADHEAFKKQVEPKFRDCFCGEHSFGTRPPEILKVSPFRIPT